MCKNKSEQGKCEGTYMKSSKQSKYNRERQNFVTEVDEITEHIDKLFHLDMHENNNALTGKSNAKPIVMDLII